MPRAEANGMELEYDTFGSPGAAPLLLVMGLGVQMITWDEDFCEQLAAAGPFHVIRFDNRDVGLSSKLDHLGLPNVLDVAAGQEQAPYALEDMADDAAALLGVLHIDRAHVVGASMGGYIVQLMALDHREKVLSLTSIMSASGGMAGDIPATPEAMQAVFAPPPTDREGLIEHGVMLSRTFHGPRYFDEERQRQKGTRAVDRSVSLAGTVRQLAAIAAAPSRLERLQSLDLPTLVIHGEVDPLVPVENGRRTAAAIPGARLLTFPDMGHDLPSQLWPEIIGAIVENARKAAVART